MKDQKLHCETVHSEVHSEVHYYSSIDTYIIDGVEFRPAKNIAPDIYVSQGGTFIRRGQTEVSYGTKTYRKREDEQIPSVVQVCTGRYETKKGTSASRSVNLGRLVLDAWSPIENEESFDADHIDNNPFNNQLKNLRWLSHQENVKRARHLIPEWLYTAEINEKKSKTYQRLKEHGLTMSYLEYRELSRSERRRLEKRLIKE